MSEQNNGLELIVSAAIGFVAGYVVKSIVDENTGGNGFLNDNKKD